MESNEFSRLKVSEWESKGLSNEKFKLPYTENKILSPKLFWNESRLRLRFWW